jgi:mono/diheme cytochrome c family protein
LDVAGDYTATLRVNDGALDSAPASVKVTATAVIALDGAKLYADNCSGCHGAINAINRMARDKRSATDIRNAINSNKGGMSFLSGLTDEEVQAIADAIAAANP